MKKTIRTVVVTLLLSLYAVSMNGQSTENPLFSYAPTPQTASFMRYGSNPVDMHTGNLSVNIPLYTYIDKDFTLPISACYSSQGLIPGRQTGILGMNWFLNCGGAVSREIRGIADDRIGSDGTKGILLGSDVYDEEDVLNIECGALNSDGLQHYTVNGRETTSDIYHFNFLEHSGTFHIDGAKRIHIYNTGGNHDTYTIIPIMPNNEELCGFTIKTGDGYEFTFGSTGIEERINSTERNIGGSLTGSSVFTFSKPGLTENPIVTWNLTCIKAPNGRTVTFNYAQVDTNIGTYISSATANNPFLVATFARGLLLKDPSGIGHMRNVSIVQTSYLERIFVNGDTEIKFFMSLKGCSDRPTAPSVITGIENDHCITQQLYKVDSLTVRNGNDRKIHSSRFTYKEKDNRLVLTKVHIDGLGDYTMSYHEEEPYPAISTADTDFWGFYNGKGNSYTTISATKSDTCYNDYIDTDAKNPDWHYSRLGCLKRITYPTQGFSTFEYSPNRADEILLKRKYRHATITPMPDNSTIVPPVAEEDEVAYLVDIYPYSTLFGSNDETGGVRLLRTTDYDAHGGYHSRTFTYSGGVVYTFPKFNTVKIGSVQIYNPMLEYPANSLDRQHIGYSTARETLSDGSYTVYRYNDYHSDPDEYEGQSHEKYSDFGNIGYSYSPAFINNILREPNSNHRKRGKTKEVTHFNSAGQAVKSSTFESSMHDTTYTAYIVMSGKYANSVKLYTGDYVVVGIGEKEYYPDGDIEKRIQFTYDYKGRKERETEIFPGGEKRHCYTEYHNDYGKHIFTIPSMTSVVHESEEKETITDITKYDYDTFGTMFLPTAVRKAQLDDGTPYPCGFDTLSYTTLQRIVSYDVIGNPTEAVDEYGVHTAFLWGHGGLYPVAKAHGMRRTTLDSLTEIASNGTLQDTLSVTQRTALCSGSQALVDIYEHIPLVGIAKHYSTNGNYISYDYDAYGRLTGISDKKGKLIRHSYKPATNSFGSQFPTNPELQPIE